MESESLLRRVAALVQLPSAHKETKESQTEQHSGRSTRPAQVRPSEDQLVLSELSMIAVGPQIENAHTELAVVVRHGRQIAPEMIRDKHAKRLLGSAPSPSSHQIVSCRAPALALPVGPWCSRIREGLPVAKCR